MTTAALGRPAAKRVRGCHETGARNHTRRFTCGSGGVNVNSGAPEGDVRPEGPRRRAVRRSFHPNGEAHHPGGVAAAVAEEDGDASLRQGGQHVLHRFLQL